VIRKLSHACVYVLDQDRAKEFYTEKLGFEVRHDVRMGTDFEGAGEGFRWLTVSPPDQPDVEIILADPERRADPRARREGGDGLGGDDHR
jgi:catechol 2,3-dioxygenase-like lactoylglutathione lyase family enzyme